MARRSSTSSGAWADLGPGLETLLSALVLRPAAGFRFAVLVGVFWLTWYLTCESITWWGGPAAWARWGLDRQVMANDISAPGSWLVAGVWFVIIGGMAGAIAGMFFAQVVARVLDATDNNYAVPFAIAATTYSLALLLIHLLLPRLEPMAS